MEDKLGQQIISRAGQLKSIRSTWENEWSDIQELVRPGAASFRNKKTNNLRINIYDGTAIHACEQLGSGLHSYLTNPTDRWFNLETDNIELMNRPEVLLWLEMVSDIVYHQFTRDDVSFNTALHECYLDLASFGTCIPLQEWNSKRKCLTFSSCQLAECFVSENAAGMIDTVYREVLMSLRQIEQLFGLERLPKKMQESKELDKEYIIIHAVYPRTDRVPGGLGPQNKEFASVWVLQESKITLKESGYDELPYHVSRWMKLPNEAYGRGPASKCISDIKGLNRYEKLILKAGEKIVDPPLVVPNDGFLAPLQTHPGALIYKENGVDNIEPLNIGSNLPLGLEMSDQKRNFIRECFYVDWLLMDKKNVEMTAYETADRRDEKLRLLSPMLSRQQNELLGPLIRRSFSLLDKAGFIPPVPEVMNGQRVRVVYVSPAAKAQVGVKAVEISRFFQDLIPLAQVNPDVMDAVNMDAAVQELALARSTSRRILRSPEEIAQIRADKQAQQQMAAAAQVAEPASKAIKNLADANATTQGLV